MKANHNYTQPAAWNITMTLRFENNQPNKTCHSCPQHIFEPLVSSQIASLLYGVMVNLLCCSNTATDENTAWLSTEKNKMVVFGDALH